LGTVVELEIVSPARTLVNYNVNPLQASGLSETESKYLNEFRLKKIISDNPIEWGQWVAKSHGQVSYGEEGTIYNNSITVQQF